MSLGYLNNLTARGSGSATRMPSAAIWKNCPMAELLHGTKDGFAIFDDLVFGHYTQATNVAASATTIRGGGGGMAGFTGTTGNTIAPSLTEPTGVVNLLATTDGEGTTLQLAGNGNIAGQFIFEADRRIWMEARVKITNITDNEHGIALVFGEEGLAAAAGVITAADAVADKDIVGFAKLATDEAVVKTVHNTASGGGVTEIDATAGTMAAATWTKLGLYCDGTRVYFFQDGVLLDNSVLLTATNFPDGEEMALYYALVVGSGGGDCVASIDWFKAAMERAA